MLLGLGLLAAAVVHAIRGLKWPADAQLAPLPLLAIAALVVANLLLTTRLWWQITRALDAQPAVKLSTMWHLVAASELLGYIPLAGWAGRAVYLRARHGVPLARSPLGLGIVMGLTVAAAGALLAGLLVGAGAGRWAMLVAALSVLTVLSVPILRRLVPRPAADVWSWLPLKALDLAAHGARLGLAMAVLCHGIGAMDAALAAAAGVVVRLMRITPAGLGLREWAIGLAMVQTAGAPAAVALAAALIDRAVETVIVLIVGHVGLWRLRWKTVGADDAPAPSRPRA